MTSAPATLRALVVDDSAYNRQTITAMLESLPGVEVIGRAMNGKEALKLAFDLSPDVITLDLEMPEMDGFSFLRLLMNKRPTPVLVVSGYAQRENVFRALELGALDFVAKPSRDVSPDLKTIERDLVQKIEVVRKLQAVRLRDRARSLAAVSRVIDDRRATIIPTTIPPMGPPPAAVVTIAASTGGPPAVQQLLCALSPELPIAVLVAQHMPARFTKAFADRLDRLVGFRVVEAEDGHPLCERTVYIAPGSSNIEVHPPTPKRGQPSPWVKVIPGDRLPGARQAAAREGPVLITPSADHLFKSAAAQYGRRLCVVVLTGMGSDGRAGAAAARQAGAKVMAEDPKSAVMPGMPYSVIEAGLVHEVLPIERMATAIGRFVESAKSST